MQVSNMGEVVPYSKKTKRRPSITRKAKIAAAICAALVVVLVFGGLYLRQQEVIRENAGAAKQYTPSPVEAITAPPTDATEDQPDGSLNDPSTPYTVNLLGDSTGNDVGEFVYQAFTTLGEETGRPVIIHNWSTDTNSYLTETQVSEGEGEPIVVWNGSAPGKSPAYSLELAAKLMPETPDLLVINHGHNAATAPQAVNGIQSLAVLPQRLFEQETEVMVTLQNPRLDDGDAIHDQIVEQLKNVYAETDVTLVDVDAAFRAGDITAYLNDDGLHPSQAGSTVWAETFLQALKG